MKREELEKGVFKALGTLDGDLSGQCFKYRHKNEIENLNEYLTFGKCDKFQEAAGIGRDWP